LAKGERLPSAYYTPLIDFTDILITNRKEMLRKPAGRPVSLGGLWDLSIKSPHRLSLPGTESGKALSQFFTVRPLRCSTTNRVVYLVNRKVKSSDDSRFHLVVNHAATALECYRRNWATITEMIQHLTQLGIPFGTFVERHGVSGPAMPRGCRPLGYREQNFIFRRSDYIDYEDIRSGFFEQAHARACGQGGGIVWRLYADVMGAESALLGP
jgi:hypothetical protein